MSEQIVIPVPDKNDQLALKNSRFAVRMAESAYYQVLFATAQRLLPDVEPSEKRVMELDPDGENIILKEIEEN
jgi:hypothetical protein